MSHTILLSEEIFIFLIIVSTMGDVYIEDIWIQNYVIALISANAFEIAKLRLIIIPVYSRGA